MAKKIVMIKTANGELALEVADAALKLAGVTGEDNQKWEANRNRSGQVTFTNVAAQAAMDVAMMGTDNGTPVHVWQPVEGADTQKWKVKGDKIVSVYADKVLDGGMFPSAGGTLQLWDDVDGESQKWVVEDVTPKKAPAKKPAAKKAPAKKAAAPKKEAAPKAAAKKAEAVKAEAPAPKQAEAVKPAAAPKKAAAKPVAAKPAAKKTTK